MNESALVIEDDRDQAYIFAEALRAAGFEPEIIRDGKAALDRLAATTPALVVLDLHIPHVSGRDLLIYIRTEPRLDKTMVMLATADHHEAQNIRDKADMVLLKPVGYDQLRDLARRLHRVSETDRGSTTSGES